MATLQQDDRTSQPIAARNLLCKIEPAPVREAMRLRRDRRKSQKAGQENGKRDERACGPNRLQRAEAEPKWRRLRRSRRVRGTVGSCGGLARAGG
jgi:hypothetical protein